MNVDGFEDSVIWLPSQTSKFSYATSWEGLRTKHLEVEWSKDRLVTKRLWRWKHYV